MANIADLISEITSSIPDAPVWESQITSSIPASKVFNDFVLAYLDFFAKTVFPIENFGVVEIVTLEGDGLGGEANGFIVKEIRSETMREQRWSVVGADSENFTCAYVYGGNVLYVEEMKVIPLVDGGCTLKYKKVDTNTTVTEDEIEGQKALIARIFKAFEDTIA
ncbi:hypothetical protein L1987_09958 [Smallanthus sonchifolius]|uniref:Uncharacterized protein n=1 Tax=Smallanthus sonchifolius TaxID=185202 RepID=A0ACB9JQR4_9ASTR|nr:hypothetical protein L1987_09958 [Smallanthus sonchifolius]